MPSIQIPETAGAILLPNAVTFPHGVLPLHIFEPRYREMLEDALKAEAIICLANLHSKETPDPSNCVSKIGIVGLIRASKKKQDGNSDLILHSLSRVEFLSWETAPSNPYPYPRAKIKPIADIIQPVTEATELVIASLRDAASRVITSLPTEIKSQINESLDRVNEDLATLTDIIAQQFVIDHKTRQSLLEENNPTTRAETLIRHLRTNKIT